jgi:hypothetical protein
MDIARNASHEKGTEGSGSFLSQIYLTIEAAYL